MTQAQPEAGVRRRRLFKVSVPEVFDRGFTAVKQNVPAAIGITLIAAVLFAALGAGLEQVGSAHPAIVADDGAGGVEGLECPVTGRTATGSEGGLCQAMLNRDKPGRVVLIGAALAMLVFALSIGYAMFFVRRGRGESAGVGTLFSAIPRVFSLALGSLLATLLVAIPAGVVVMVSQSLRAGDPAGDMPRGAGVLAGILAVAGVFYVARMTAGLALWPLLVVDQRMGAVRAISTSLTLMNGNRLRLWYFSILSIVILAITAIVPFALLLVLPILVAAFACFYDKLIVAHAEAEGLSLTSVRRSRRAARGGCCCCRRTEARASTPASTDSRGYEVVATGYVELPDGQQHPAIAVTPEPPTHRHG